MEDSGLMQVLRDSKSFGSRFARECVTGISVAYLRYDALATTPEWRVRTSIEGRELGYQRWARGVWWKRLVYST